MSDNFVNKNEEIPETNLDVEKEDRLAEESEVTGKISRGELKECFPPNQVDEVEGLKDSIGGGQILDDSEGYTRSSNKDVNAMKQEQEVDEAVDSI
jgi:hypothetical protein